MMKSYLENFFQPVLSLKKTLYSYHYFPDKNLGNFRQKFTYQAHSLQNYLTRLSTIFFYGRNRPKVELHKIPIGKTRMKANDLPLKDRISIEKAIALGNYHSPQGKSHRRSAVNMKRKDK